MGLTALVSKGLTFASIITLFTLIIPTIINVIRKWPDADYAHMTKENNEIITKGESICYLLLD